jgi:hypothetical protein
MCLRRPASEPTAPGSDYPRRNLIMNASSSRLELHPERALPTLPWVAALLVLVVNDHLLKGAGLLPTAVTGKLSDFAGLLVAPVLLATLIRARSTRALIACHVAVGIVFAGIQLSLPFADLWSATMGLLGHPWRITRDPTDLIALPMLLVSWRVLVPAMTRELGAVRVELRQLGIAGLSTLGLWSSVATSDADSGVDTNDEWYEDVYGNLFINNANDHDIAVLVRPLRPEIELDCSVIATDPGRLLPAAAFGDAVHWVLPARTNLAVIGSEGGCDAVWVAGEGVPPTILFWHEADYYAQWFAGQTFASEGLDSDGTALVFAEGGASWTGGEAFRFAVDATIPEQSDSCLPISDERVDWDANLPRDRPLELLGLNYGPDGCFELELADLWNEGSVTSYVCAPESALPLAIGDRIQLGELVGGDGQRSLTVKRLDPISNEVALAVDGEPQLRVDLLRGADGLGNLDALLGDRPVTAIPRPSCEWTVDDACAVDERPFDLALVGVEGTLSAGAPMVVLVDPIGGGDSIRERELTLVHAQERALLDRTCAEGAKELGFDLDAVVVSRSAP